MVITLEDESFLLFIIISSASGITGSRHMYILKSLNIYSNMSHNCIQSEHHLPFLQAIIGLFCNHFYKWYLLVLLLINTLDLSQKPLPPTYSHPTMAYL